MTCVYCGGQDCGAVAQSLLAESPAPAIAQVGNALPRARSLSTWLIGGTHCGMACQFGAAKQRSTRQPSAELAAAVLKRQARLTDARENRRSPTRLASRRGATRVCDPLTTTSMRPWTGTTVSASRGASEGRREITLVANRR